MMAGPAWCNFPANRQPAAASQFGAVVATATRTARTARQARHGQRQHLHAPACAVKEVAGGMRWWAKQARRFVHAGSCSRLARQRAYNCVKQKEAKGVNASCQ